MKERIEGLNLFIVAVLFLLFFIPSMARGEPPLSAEFSIDAGYRRDNLDWNIAGTSAGTGPNVLSELAWKDLEILELKAATRVNLLRYVHIRGSVDRGLIFSGENQDSDYLGNFRTLEFSRSNNSSDDGAVWDASAGVGLRAELSFDSGTLAIMPLVGWSYHRQDLTITDGFQTIPATGAFSGLDSTYEARWKGPWYGADISFTQKDLTLRGTFEYHAASYRALADWNLRSDFAHPVSFEHTADGSGYLVALLIDYAVTERWSVRGGVDYQDWQTDYGVDRTFFSDGSTSDTRLNEVNWDSLSATLGLGCRF
ncbi:MAG TPA: TonB-dependent receptor [Thermodesulfobacteriota bacterium]|nr:TonB-dependent receptor [Thermodesulfobacteriota bacterium]